MTWSDFVQKPRLLWEAFTQAKSLNKSPAEIYGITEELTAWCFNRAVLTFGNALENELHAIAKKAKTQQAADNATRAKFDRWISSADEGVARGRFRDPAKM